MHGAGDVHAGEDRASNPRRLRRVLRNARIGAQLLIVDEQLTGAGAVSDFGYGIQACGPVAAEPIRPVGTGWWGSSGSFPERAERIFSPILGTNPEQPAHLSLSNDTRRNEINALGLTKGLNCRPHFQRVSLAEFPGAARRGLRPEVRLGWWR
jgi:hypothetical protein